MKDKTVVTRIPKRDLKRFIALCKNEGVYRSEKIREMIRAELARYEKKGK